MARREVTDEEFEELMNVTIRPIRKKKNLIAPNSSSESSSNDESDDSVINNPERERESKTKLIW